VKTVELQGRRCVGGLDLAATKDLTAFVLVFPDDQGSYDVLAGFGIRVMDFGPESTAITCRTTSGRAMAIWN
jgi:phage terminase large subunit-like protein